MIYKYAFTFSLMCYIFYEFMQGDDENKLDTITGSQDFVGVPDWVPRPSGAKDFNCHHRDVQRGVVPAAKQEEGGGRSIIFQQRYSQL